jgi:AAA domain (dynein-related subfamily)
MGLAEKNFPLPKFDKVIRTQQGEVLLALIYSTHWEWIKKHNSNETRKKSIELRLKPLYDILKKDGSGTYGDPGKDISDQFSRQYTIGHDMGIWTGRDLKLSKYALEVAEHKVTISDYLSRVFQNLFTYIENRYVHFLYDISSYMEEKHKKILNIEDIPKALNINGDISGEIREQSKIILNYLSYTYYFDVQEGELGQAKSLAVASSYSPSKIKKICNLEYRNKNGEETRKFFTNKLNYSNYIAKYNHLHDDLEYQNVEIEYNDVKHKDEIECIVRTNTVQKIIYGPPGIGKSYSIKNEIKVSYPDYELQDDNPFVFRTTLHPEYSYNDFIGQIMPVVNGDNITYDFTPGVFTQALKKAINYPKKDIYLILEEMSRANVASVFGDIFQLLDREKGVSLYHINHDLISHEVYGDNRKIYLPKNFHIIGTVNTSDQNVYVMDTAFKRRFDFEYMSLKPVMKNGVYLNNIPLVLENSRKTVIECDWITLYQAVNDFIVKELKLSEDKQIGQFFIKFSEDIENNKKAISNKLLQYLWQDVHMATFSNVSLFRSHIETFSEAYEEIERCLSQNKPITIFSDKLLEYITGFKDDDKNG